jgi:hypothetical protein
MDSISVLSRDKENQQTNKRGNSMKLKNLLTICGAAALMLSAGSIYAQPGGGGPGGGFGGGPGGGGPGGGGFGGGNFDPAQMQQRMMDNYRQQLNFTNDTEWSAVQPLVQKVSDARMAGGMGGGMRGMFGRNRGGGGGGGGGFGGGNNPFNQPNPERDALQQALDDNAPAAQVKALLEKYQAAQKAKQAKLAAAQADLRKVLSVPQEAQATLMGLLD